MAYLALFGLVGLSFTIGSSLAFWHERKQPIGKKLMAWHITIWAMCLWTVIWRMAT